MIDPVVIDFSARGLTDVTRAFETVEQRMRKFEQAAAADARRGASERTRTTQGEVQGRERAYQRLVSELERDEARQTRATEREAKARQRETERESRQREQIVRRSSEMAGRLAEQAANAEVRAQQKAAREIERIEEQKLRVRIRSSEMAGRLAAREAQQEAAASERAGRRRGAAMGRYAGIGMSSVGSLVSGAGSIVGATLGLGGGYMIADSVRKEFAAEKTAALLVNAGTTGGVVPGTVKEAMSAASAASLETGMSRNDLLTGALTYSKNARGGDFKGALGQMGFFAKMAEVTGTDINDIAQAAGTLQSQNKDLNGPEGAKKMQQLLLNTLAEAHAGSMGLPDAAKQFGILGATRAYYKGDETANQRTLIGLGQIARVAGDAGEAGTFVKDIATEAGAANRRFKKKTGRNLINFDEKTGQMDAPEKVVEQVLRNTGGNIHEIGELFGQRGSRLFGELAGVYQKADTAAGGGAKGREAGVAAAMAKVTEVTGATMTPGELEKQHRVIQDTPAKKFEMALNRVELVMQDRLAPFMGRFADKFPQWVPKIEKAIDAVAKFADWFISNPIQGIGAVILAAVAKDVGSAALGATIKSLIQHAFAGAGAPPPGGGGGGGGPMPLGTKVGTAIGVGLLAAEAQTYLIDRDIANREATQRANATGSTSAVMSAYAIERASREGTITPQQAEEARQQALKLQHKAETARADIGENHMGIMQTAAMQIMDPAGAKEHAQATYNEQVRTYQQAKQAADEMRKAAEAAATALKNLSTAAANTDPRNPGRTVSMDKRGNH